MQLLEVEYVLPTFTFAFKNVKQNNMRARRLASLWFIPSISFAEKGATHKTAICYLHAHADSNRVLVMQVLPNRSALDASISSNSTSWVPPLPSIYMHDL